MHRGLQRAGRTTKIHADDAGRGLEVDSGAAPAVGRAPQHRQGQGPNERSRWWRTRRGRSYNMRVTPAAGWRSTAWRRRQWTGRRGAGAGRSRRSGRTGGEPGAGAATRYTPSPLSITRTRGCGVADIAAHVAAELTGLLCRIARSLCMAHHWTCILGESGRLLQVTISSECVCRLCFGETKLSPFVCVLSK